MQPHPCPSRDEVLTQGVGTSQGEGTSGTDMDMYGVCCVCCVTVCVMWWCVVRVGVCGDARPFRLLRQCAYVLACSVFVFPFIY